MGEPIWRGTNMKRTQLAKLLTFLPLAMTLIWLQFLPDRVPIRYSFSGAIDAWGSKWTYLILPGVVLAMGIAIAATALRTNRASTPDAQQQAHLEANVKVLQGVLLATGLFFTGLQAVILYFAGRDAAGTAPSGASLLRVIAIGLGLMSVFLGNLMPRSRRNSTFGLRCAWSQYSDETWRRTNWFGGIAMMVSGILTVLGAVLTPETWAIGIALAMISLALIVSLCYARRVYRKEKVKG